MALPKVEMPTYELTLPSKDEIVAFRPFTVKEEKILMIAGESAEQKQIINAVCEIINTCTFNKLNARKLPLFDIEYIFLQIRAKSVGEIAEFRILCPDDKNTYTKIEVDISKVEVHVDDEHNNRVIVDEDRKLGVVFSYPTLDISKVDFNLDDMKTEDVFNVLVSCVDHIFEGEKIYPAKDSTKEELDEFFENLNQQSFVEIKKFFDTMPQLKHEVEVENPKTKVKSKVTFRGLNDFFQYASPTTA
jgi:hypothetical protein